MNHSPYQRETANVNKISRACYLIVVVAFASASILGQSAVAAFRDVQFKSIDFETAVIELHNFGDSVEPFTNWRFCSHDDDQERQYSAPGALNSIFLGAGESVYFHFNNDAPIGATDAFNIAGLGSFATELDRGPYAIGLYVNSGFGVPASLVDHVQWNIDGADDEKADFRSLVAQNAGLWTDEAEWVPTTFDTRRLELLVDGLGNPTPDAHGPASYRVIGPPLITPADFDFDADVDADDLATLRASYGSGTGGDIDFDSDTDGTDFLLFQQVYTGPGPLLAATAVPEPASLLIGAVGMLFVCGRNRRWL